MAGQEGSIFGALAWNLFHGRDKPPGRELYTWRSRLLRVTERSATHVQVNRPLLNEFAGYIDSLDWQVALLQEAPPRWLEPLVPRVGGRRARWRSRRATGSRPCGAPWRGATPT